METETGSEVRLESQSETRRRRALGVLLSGALGMSVGFGMFGGWDWVGIIGLPVRPGPVRPILGACVTGMPIAIPFLVWGLLVAWRREGREVAIRLVLCCAAALGVVAVLVIGPWKSRSLLRWPFVFLAATMAQIVFALALGLLIYFRTSYGTVGAWLCLVLSSWAVLFGMVRVYASHMKRFSPARGGRDGVDSASTE